MKADAAFDEAIEDAKLRWKVGLISTLDSLRRKMQKFESILVSVV